jgi:hypothetical protein
MSGRMSVLPRESPLKVFISWSGVPSRKLAEVLHWWLPMVIQGTEPFVSAKDIDKGSTWTTVLAQELEDTDFGIICLTPENLTSPWLNYEAGSITKSVKSRVCPLLLGVEKTAVSGPLAQLQLTALEYDDIALMVRSVNKAAGLPLTDTHLDEALEMWWSRLEEKISGIEIPPAPGLVNVPEPAKPQSSDSELLHEVLESIRRLDRRLASLEGVRVPRELRANAKSANATGMTTIDLAHSLRGEGILISQIKPGTDEVLIIADKLPNPIGLRAHDLLSDYASKNRMPIRIETPNGRVVKFDEGGWSDEPPF